MQKRQQRKNNLKKTKEGNPVSPLFVSSKNNITKVSKHNTTIMDNNANKSQHNDSHRVVFTRTVYDAEKIGLICDRDRLFQQLLDYKSSIQKWELKEITSVDVEKKSNERKRKKEIISHLREQITGIQHELLRLDELISPFEILQNVTTKTEETCSDI